jgi:hypothetical protein
MVEGGRLTARKARIADVVAGNVEEAAAPRVNVVGVVVTMTPGEPPSFVLDDRSALVVVRQFDKQPAPPVGTVALVIGRVREYGGERYITSEIVRQVANKWLEVRALELMHQTSFVTPTLKPAMVEERVVDDVTDGDATVLGIIRALDIGQGVLVDDILAKAPDREKTINLLLQRGDVFEVSPGRLKILE